MNVERIEQCIQMMERATNLKMTWFQSKPGTRDGIKLRFNELTDSAEQLHACGNSACFAGYLAMDSNFVRAGGIMTFEGAPSLDGWEDSEAVAHYLDINPRLAHSMVFGNEYRPGFGDPDIDVHMASIDLYPVEFEDVKPEHVIAVLRRILSGELK